MVVYSVILTFESVNETKRVTIQMTAIAQYFPVVIYSLILSFESVDGTLKFDHSK